MCLSASRESLVTTPYGDPLQKFQIGTRVLDKADGKGEKVLKHSVITVHYS